MRFSGTQRTNKRTAIAMLSRFLLISALLAVAGLALVGGVSSAVESGSASSRTETSGASDRVRFPRGRPSSAARNAPEPFALAAPLLATITVDRTDDDPTASLCTAAPNDCSLRGAITFANLFPGTIVSVPSGSYNLTIPGAGEFFAANNLVGDLDITGDNTSIVGAGAATTIITQTTAGSRVIEVNPNIVANFTASISGVTISGGTESAGIGGGGILSGALNNNLTISSSVISGNSATGVGTFGGGGICHTGGNLTITDSTISGNSTSASGGGVSYSAGDPAGSNGATGTISVSGSTFTGNTANSASAGGGALDLYDFNVSASVYNVTTSSFSNNSAPNRSGGAIVVRSGGPLTVTLSSFDSNSAFTSGGAIFSSGTSATVTYSRLVDNTAPTGSAIFRSSGLFTANDDWWGINTGPGPGVFSDAGGNIIPASWLQLRASATPSTICAGDTSTIVADIKQRNVGAPLTTELNGLPPFPATFINTTPAVGSLSAVSANFVNGEATATFTGATTGTANIDVVADNQTVTVSIVVEADATTDPADQSVCEGGTATFTTNSTGPGSFTYVWKKGATVLNNGDLGGRVTITSGSNTSTLSISNVQPSDADTYTVEATGDCSTVSQTATLSINAATTTTDPADQTVCQGAMASFSTTAGGTGPFSYAWTVDGNPAGTDSPTLNVDTTGLSLGNHTVQVTTTGACGSAVQTATLTVQAATTTTDPADATVCQGAMASFSTTAGGTGPFSYAWTVDGNASGGDSPTLNVDTTGLSVGNHTVQVTTTGGCGSAVQTATLTVQPTTTTTDPADAAVCQGATANFSTTAGGTGPFSYAWTVDGSPAGTNSPNLSVDTTGFTVGTHTVQVTTTGACGSAVQTATLTVLAPTTTTDPPDQTVCKGATATFSTTAGGTGPFSYAWTVDGVPFGGDSPTINVPTGAMSSGPHTIVVTTTGSCGSASQTAILTVGNPPVITLTTSNINVWPPNHQYQTFTAADFGATASGCEGDLTSSIVITNVSSDELQDNPGGADGNTLNDIVIAANCKSVQLRRERDANLNGRVYTITFKVTDSGGNSTTATATVSVPLNNNGSQAVNGPGPGYSVNSLCP